MDLYAFRDMLKFDDDEREDDDNHEYNIGGDAPAYGITLYFVHGAKEPNAQRAITDSFDVSRVFDLSAALTEIVKGKGHDEAIRGIQKWITNNSDIVVFFRNCIAGNTGSSRCLNLAKQAGIKYRRQNALGLYQLLKLEQEFTTAPPKPKQKPPKKEPPIAQYEEIRRYFKRQFAIDGWFGKFDYQMNKLSACSADELHTAIEPGDFLFEMGELSSGEFKYWGHYHAATRKFNPLHLYPSFEMQQLFSLLRRL